MKFYRSLTAVWMSVFVALVLPGPATGGVWNRDSKGAPAPHHVSSQLISKPSLSLQISEQRALELYGRQPLTGRFARSRGQKGQIAIVHREINCLAALKANNF